MSKKRLAGYAIEIQTLSFMEIVGKEFVTLTMIGENDARQQLGELPSIKMSPVTLPSG